MLIHLILNLRRLVRHINTTVRVARAHLGLRALQRGEELCMQQRGLGVLELLRDVAREAEVRVLVDRAGDEARDVRGRAENVREGVGERRGGLDGGEVDLADVVRVVEAEGGFRLAVCYLARDLGDVLVEGAADVGVVAEDEGSREIESDGDNVAGVFSREPLRLLDFELMFEQELFVVGQLNDQWDLEYVLQPSEGS